MCLCQSTKATCSPIIRLAPVSFIACFFFFNDTATTEIYTLSLHDALPISWQALTTNQLAVRWSTCRSSGCGVAIKDRKSTRLNSSHLVISYAVFCLKKRCKEPHAEPAEYRQGGTSPACGYPAPSCARPCAHCGNLCVCAYASQRRQPARQSSD